MSFLHSYCSILLNPRSIYNPYRMRGINMNNEPLVIKRKSEDGNKIITVRIREDILAELDKLSAETNHSRNELINLILEHGVKNIKIE